MFCMNCGTKLPDNAKFCFNCGAKVPEMPGSAPAAAEPAAPAPAAPDVAAQPAPEQREPVPVQPELPEQPDEPEVEGSHFTILNRYEVDLPRATALQNQLWKPFNEEGTKAAFSVKYKVQDLIREKGVEDPVDFSSQLLDACIAVCDPLFEHAVDVLNDYGIDYVTKDDLWEKLSRNVASTELMKARNADKAAIEQYAEDLAREKEANKANWQGGGFGVTGAIKGALEAKMLNSAQDALSSLGRTLTGNTYSGRLKRFIADRSAKRDYPEMACDFIDQICRYDLFNTVWHILVKNGKMPSCNYETSKAGSKRKNLMERYDAHKITREQLLQGFCECLEITGDANAVYQDLLLAAPEAGPDVFRMAEADGGALALALQIWDRYQEEDQVLEHFQFPAWIPTNLRKVFYPVVQPDMLLALCIQLRDMPERFSLENGKLDVALTRGTYTLPAYVRNMDFWGMEPQVTLTWEQPETPDWTSQNVHFHLVQFAGATGKWAQKQRDASLQQAQDALDSGRQEAALSAFNEAREWGSAEAAYQAGKLYEQQGKREAAEWAYMEGAVGGSGDAAWQQVLLLKQLNAGNQIPAYLKLATEAGKKLEEQGKYEEAIRWYEKEAAEQDGTACLYLGQLAEAGKGMEKDETKALEWYGKALDYGCEGAKKALADLAFRKGESARERAQSATGDEAQRARLEALADYRKAWQQGREEAADAIVALDLEQGKAYREAHQEQGALSLYEEAVELGSTEAILEAGWLCGNPSLKTYDFSKARRWYRKALQETDDPGPIRKEWDVCKANVPLSDRVACLVAEIPTAINTTFYYEGEDLTGPLENAMKAYGSAGGADASQVVLLCDASHSFLWGKGEKGLLITRDGMLYSSQGLRVSLAALPPLLYDENAQLVEPDSGTVVLKFLDVDKDDKAFCDLLNEIVLVPRAVAAQAAPEQAAPEVGYCPNCGAPVKPGSKFCGQCGCKLQ
ncbi:MAG: zinc-ribbon domain-containing protein [Acidaminococcus sp.]|uniref:zinc-ribbon domain-containing protein n=1 Tax=Acidaminococcus sp. TaxID=1872103 RepID=UPI003F13FBB5